MTDAILAIDQGTTSSRALVFDPAGNVLGLARRELAQHYPRDGWVEHDPEDIWRDTLAVGREAMAAAAPARVAGIGIANQRETTIVWDRETGAPVHRAIVWQDRRTEAACAALADAEPMLRARTGLLLDPYFSATKIAWLLDHVSGARARAEAGRLAFGTVDSFLIWRLTGGRVHATDATNASRTLLFDINAQAWDDELLRLFRVPAALLPEVRDNVADFGTTDAFGPRLRIAGVAGDQQAALIGQGCLSPGMIKSTYGTGCFALAHTGDAPVLSTHRLLATTAYRLDGRPAYATEGAIFVAGAAIKWLRDRLGVIASAEQTEALAASLQGNDGVYLVPAFTGLGAPRWDARARGLICGMTLDTGPAHLARAALESVAYQTSDLIEAMRADATPADGVLRIDGGMAVNDWFCRFLANILDRPVERPPVLETTALGAVRLAGFGLGLHPLAPEASIMTRFEPGMDPALRERLLAGWQNAIERAL